MFSIPRGATQNFTATVAKDGVLVDLGVAGTRIYFTVRVADAVIISKANTAGGGSNAQIEVTALGTYKIKFSTTDTARDPVRGVCDCFVVNAAGEYVQAIKNAPFEITQSQTRAFPVAP